MRRSLSLTLYLILSGAMFLVVGILHLLRLLTDTPVVVGGNHVPYALSIVGFPVATFYAIWAAFLLRRE